MSKINQNQNGFSVIELLMIIVIIALIVVVGWLVYKNHNKPTKTVTITKSQSIPKTTSSAVRTNTSPSTSYLDITQLGIKFAIPQSVSDLSYTWANDTATLHSQAEWKYQQVNDPTCAKTDEQISSEPNSPPEDWAGYISKLPVGQQEEDGVSATVTINGSTYGYSGHEDGCDPSDPGNPNAVNMNTSNDDKAIESALSNATAD